MKIEVRNVKHAPFASQETMCFQAAIYVDGKKIGAAENDGHGGCTMIHPYSLVAQLNEYGKTLPKRTYIAGDERHEYEQDAYSIIDDLVARWLDERAVKRMLNGKIAFTKKGQKGIWTLKVNKGDLPKHLADPLKLQSHLKDCDKILNLMSLAAAVALYREAA